jgi:hypothetical protein
MRALILGSATTASISLFSFSIISVDVPFGASDAKPTAGLVARHKFIDVGEVRQYLQARTAGYG